MPATSILAFIVPKLGIQAENAVSACFHFLISTHPEIAESFLRFVSSAGIELPRPLEFTTQVVWEKAGARPDMIGRHKDEAFLVVEAKFGAPLTKRQPVDYVFCLPKEGAGVLLFLAPARRIAELWPKLQRRCKSANLSLGPEVKGAEGLSAISVRERHRLAIAS